MENSHLLGAMQVFVSVVESGSFSESARRLGLSQPSISRQVSSLEEHLGVRLLQRTTRRLSLTEAGQVYYERARQIQRDVVEAGLAIGGFKDHPSGVLRIASPYTWTEMIFAPYIGEFLQRYPDIKLDIECNDRFQDMIEERLDLVIRVGIPQESSFVAVPLAEVELALCASPHYLELHGMPRNANDLRNHNFVLFEDFTELLFQHGNEEQTIEISGNISANSVPVMIASALQHVGISALPLPLVQPYLHDGGLVRILPDAQVQIKRLPIKQVFALYSNRKHLPAKARVFIDFLKQSLA